MAYRLVSINKKTKEVMIGQESFTKDNLRDTAKKLKKDYIVYLVDTLEVFK